MGGCKCSGVKYHQTVKNAGSYFATRNNTDRENSELIITIVRSDNFTKKNNLLLTVDEAVVYGSEAIKYVIKSEAMY